uniref:Uncharacterized protein n=1 Tax=Panagrolaimus sp. PS1159 TaxID=55785 RepID=A0AC35FID2_9BILA
MDVTKPKFKMDFLVCSNALSDRDGVVHVDIDPLDVYKEVTEATFEVVPENHDENVENIPAISKENERFSIPPPSRKRHTLFDIEDIPNIIQNLTEDETIGWTREALLRLIHVVNQTYDLVGKDFPNLYLGIVKSKMERINTSERLISESYIHPDDIKKFRKWKKTRDRTDIQYFRPNYDVDLSLSKIRDILFYFYEASDFLSFNRPLKVGNYKINASEKAEMSGSRKSSRSRKNLSTP